MAHVELPQEEFEPLILSMKRVFAPFVDAIPSIIRIPDEIERLSKTIIDDVDSGQPDRLDTASEKLVDPMIQGLKDFYAKQDADREAELAKIAAEREAAIAEVQKLQDLGVPAEVTKQNTVNILNEKEILEKQKEFIKEQKEVSFLESQIADEKSKGDDADSERLLMLKEALDRQNQLVEEQGKVLGDRLPRQKVPEAITKRDFIPGPLMEAYDNIASTAGDSARAIGSIFQPLIGLKKLFTQKEEYEEEEQDGKKKRDKGSALATLLATVKLIAFAAALAVAIKGLYKIAKFLPGFGPEEEIPADQMQRGETRGDYNKRVDAMTDKSEVEKQELKNEAMDPVSKFFYESRFGNKQKDLDAAAQRDENIRAFDLRNQYAREELKKLGGGAANQANTGNTVNNNVLNQGGDTNVTEVVSKNKAGNREDAVTQGGKA